MENTLHKEYYPLGKLKTKKERKKKKRKKKDSK